VCASSSLISSAAIIEWQESMLLLGLLGVCHGHLLLRWVVVHCLGCHEHPTEFCAGVGVQGFDAPSFLVLLLQQQVQLAKLQWLLLRIQLHS